MENLELLAAGSSKIELASKNLRVPDTDGAVSSLQAGTVRISTHAKQILVAFRAIHREILRWNIAPALSNHSGGNGSSGPGSRQ